MKTFLKRIQSIIRNKIGIISLILSFIALISGLILLYTEQSKTIFWISNFFNFANLKFMVFRTFELEGGSFSGENRVRADGLAYAFNLVFLIASIIYLYSKKTHKNLLQFAYSIIIFSAFMLILEEIIRQFNSFTLLETVPLIFFIRNVILIIFSYSILKITDESITPLTEKNEFSEVVQPEYIKADKYMRGLNLLIDTFFLICLTFKVIMKLPRNFMQPIENIFQEATYAFLMIFFAIIYYTFFEVLFKRTPAKYLTQTFVSGTAKTSVPTSSIFIRSIARKIPFNFVSFLNPNPNSNGWHDALSNTRVMSLNKNKKQFKYLLVLGIVGLFFFINIEVNKYREKNISNNKFSSVITNEAKALKESLKNLSAGDLILLKNTKFIYNGTTYLFNTLSVNDDSVSLALIDRHYKHTKLSDVYSAYEANPESFKKVDVLKEYISKGICEQFDYSVGLKNCGFKYIEDEPNLRVHAIVKIEDAYKRIDEFNKRK